MFIDWLSFNTQIRWLKNIIHFDYVEIAQKNMDKLHKNGRYHLERLFPKLILNSIYLSS